MVKTVTLWLGDCLDRMREIADGSVDCIVTDPPYPEISRPYGRMTEAEWDRMMRRLIPECRRVLKPSGSAVFILQPNSRKVGSMRPWLWDFMAWTCREWNMVQDAYWWNHTTPPTVHCQRTRGLMRPSLKACVWLGASDCYRAQDAVLWAESDANQYDRLERRFDGRKTMVSGHSKSHTVSTAATRRGGVTPFNVLPLGSDARWNGGTHGHGASTPLKLANWWIRYICPPGGVVLDPFIGSGTMGIAAMKLGRSIIGIERDPGYFAIAEKRIAEARKAIPESAA